MKIITMNVQRISLLIGRTISLDINACVWDNTNLKVKGELLIDAISDVLEML